MPMRRVLAPDGSVVGDTDVGLSDDELRELLRLMLACRRLDRECWALQRQGELTVYPPFEGQEAAQIGSAFALATGDMAFPTFRELAAAVTRGVDVVAYLEYHRGTWHGGPYDPYANGFAPICVPVATQIVHAVGWGLGQKLAGTDRVSLAYFGDGSASEGDFHEGANMASVYRTPTVLLCQNNGWAISVPIAQQTVAPIAARAAGYGMPGVRVDGNDVLAVYATTREAVARARAGDGPTLIEAMTYRIGAHSTADDPKRYRDESTVEPYRGLDPLVRYRAYLLGRGLVDEAWIAEREAQAEAWVSDIRARTIALGTPDAGEIFDHTYAAPPASLAAQRAEGTADA